jgi:hypothetical protein
MPWSAAAKWSGEAAAGADASCAAPEWKLPQQGKGQTPQQRAAACPILQQGKGQTPQQRAAACPILQQGKGQTPQQWAAACPILRLGAVQVPRVVGAARVGAGPCFAGHKIAVPGGRQRGMTGKIPAHSERLPMHDCGEPCASDCQLCLGLQPSLRSIEM